jgi:hypothetical protein
MADRIGVESGKEATGSQTQDAGNATLARGAAGLETGARPDATGDRHGDLEDRRETQQVNRISQDGIGEELTKDHS